MKRVNLELSQGADFTYSFVLQDDESDLPVDLSGYSANTVLRKHPESNSYFSFTSTLNANGEVVLSMNSSVSAQVAGGDWVYEVKLTDGDGRVSKPLSGRIRVREGL